MEKPSLAGCWAKVARAREHTYRLELLAEAFLKRRPNQFRFDHQSEPPWIIIRVSVEPIPLEFSTIGGDLVQNLRSALDYLVWQLVGLEGGVPGRHTSFPILVCEADFDARVRNPSKGRLSPLHGLDPSGDKWALIERSQPYKRSDPPETELAIIAKFSNRDKHHGLLPGVSFSHGFDLGEIATAPEGIELKQTFESGLLEHGTEIARFRPTATGTVQMHRDPPFEITLSEREDSPEYEALTLSVGTFDRLRAGVVEIIRDAERFF